MRYEILVLFAAEMVRITLPDDDILELDKPVTPLAVAETIGSGLAKAALAARCGSNSFLQFLDKAIVDSLNV